MQELIIDN